MSCVRIYSARLRIAVDYIDGLVQDCSNSSALAMELLQSCTKLSICILISGVLCQKQVSRTWISDYIPQYLWDLLLVPTFDTCLWNNTPDIYSACN